MTNPRMTDLLNPELLTMEVVVLVLGILAVYLWGGIALRSVLIISVWVFTAMSFIIAVLWQMDMVFFWLFALLNTFAFPVVILARGVFDVNL